MPTVLIADDNKINQLVAKLMVERNGYDVLLAENGAVALELAATGKADMVLMDVHMPIMDGLEATREIRNSGNTIPILAITGSYSEEEIHACLDVGMNGIVSKPFNDEELKKTLATYLQK